MDYNVIFPRILPPEKYRSLSPQDQEEYVARKIEEILMINTNGVTISDVSLNTPFTRPTIIKHLEKIVATRKGYKIRRGRLSMYFPNGRVVHPEGQIETKTDTGNQYRATFLNNNFGEFIYIEDLTPNTVSGGSILIKKHDYPNFLNFLDSVEENRKAIRNE
ncbi:MAG: hypothetical protein PHG85_01065 [Candidatus Altiarchaeota archaeon]|nr:hypothetical protein [Candidatus Altiarchaeota archaeon]